jgi:hypothetical protein
MRAKSTRGRRHAEQKNGQVSPKLTRKRSVHPVLTLNCNLESTLPAIYWAKWRPVGITLNPLGVRFSCRNSTALHSIAQRNFAMSSMRSIVVKVSPIPLAADVGSAYDILVLNNGQLTSDNGLSAFLHFISPTLAPTLNLPVPPDVAQSSLIPANVGQCRLKKSARLGSLKSLKPAPLASDNHSLLSLLRLVEHPHSDFSILPAEQLPHAGEAWRAKESLKRTALGEPPREVSGEPLYLTRNRNLNLPVPNNGQLPHSIAIQKSKTKNGIKAYQGVSSLKKNFPPSRLNPTIYCRRNPEKPGNAAALDFSGFLRVFPGFSGSSLRPLSLIPSPVGRGSCPLLSSYMFLSGNRF